jgi:hypothetical protein
MPASRDSAPSADTLLIASPASTELSGSATSLFVARHQRCDAPTPAESFLENSKWPSRWPPPRQGDPATAAGTGATNLDGEVTLLLPPERTTAAIQEVAALAARRKARARGIDLYVLADETSYLYVEGWGYRRDRYLGSDTDGRVRAALRSEPGPGAGSSPLWMFLVGVPWRSMITLRDRGVRTLLVEVGGYLEALATRLTGAGLQFRHHPLFVDRALNELLGFDGVDHLVLAVAEVDDP